MSQFGIRQYRMLIVISAPSGCGKTTVTRALLAEDPSLAYSISTTTRPPRPGETDGRDYYFVSREEFQRRIAEGEFLEWAEVHGNLYGTRRDLVQRLLSGDRDVVLDVDIQGAMSLKHGSPGAVLIFLVPPSLEALQERLRARAQDSDEVMARRLRAVGEEMSAASRFDYLVANDRLDAAVAMVRAIIAAERCRTSHRMVVGESEEAAEREAAASAPPRPFAPSIIFASRAIAELLERAERVARTDSPVLLLGESGTGKEILAEAIHRASRRAAGPLVRVNCGAIPATLLESELFGYVAGAFTGALRDHAGLFRAADRGTIFLDEIGDLPLDLQVKLLRVLQDGEVRPVGGTHPMHVNVRLMAATNRDLAGAVEAGRFRQDLFYRLNVVLLRLPSLRERREDIPVLVAHFLRRFVSPDHPLKTLDPEAMDLLMKADWPGNVRQLENAIEHAVVLSRSDLIGPGDLPESIRRGRVAPPSPPAEEVTGDTLRDIEVSAIQRALKQARCNLTHAARALGTTRRALSYRLEKYGIQVERRRGRPKRG